MPIRSGARRTLRSALAIVALFASPSAAHDLWMLPGKFRLGVGEMTRVFINSGDLFPESLTLLGEQRLTEVRALSAAGNTAVTGFRADGRSLTFDFQPETPGPHVIALGTKPRTVRMNGKDFEEYLSEAGLTGIEELRETLGEVGQPAVERYAKWAKTVVEVGEEPPSENAWAAAVGAPLEIIPIDPPNGVKPGESLRLRVLYAGDPLPAAAITGGRAAGPANEIAASTDERGEASVTLSTSGRWYVRAIHMIRVENDPQVQWESFWATLTFEVPATPESPQPERRARLRVPKREALGVGPQRTDK
jgi:hypothetical protein